MTTTVPPTTETDHPYLSGNYAPVQEEATATDLEVTGSIPEYLDGRYLRIGPESARQPRSAAVPRVPRRGHGAMALGLLG
jgi:carotenoid cleavage dioxygenase